MRRLLIRPQARLDMLEIWHHVAKENIGAADRVRVRLDAAIRDLQRMPGMGHRRADVRRSDYRFWSVYSYVIAYASDASSLTIVRVVHGHRDFRKLFEPRG